MWFPTFPAVTSLVKRMDRLARFPLSIYLATFNSHWIYTWQNTLVIVMIAAATIDFQPCSSAATNRGRLLFYKYTGKRGKCKYIIKPPFIQIIATVLYWPWCVYFLFGRPDVHTRSTSAETTHEHTLAWHMHVDRLSIYQPATDDEVTRMSPSSSFLLKTLSWLEVLQLEHWQLCLSHTAW